MLSTRKRSNPVPQKSLSLCPFVLKNLCFSLPELRISLCFNVIRYALSVTVTPPDGNPTLQVPVNEDVSGSIMRVSSIPNPLSLKSLCPSVSLF